MPILHDFDYFKPATLKETINLISNKKSAAILAGGTDLIVNLKEETATPEIIVDIKSLSSLNKIEFKDDSLRIGALVTFTDLLESPLIKEKFPLIWEVSKTVASMGIRNRATMVGNICSAVSCLDSGPLLCVYEADVCVKSTNGERIIPIEDWFLGNKKTALKNGELVTHISIPQQKQKTGGCFVRLSRYCGEDLAQVNLAILAFVNNTYRISYGAVAPVPLRANKIESLLSGKKINDTLIEQTKELIPDEISPITDVRATKEYRLHVAKVMFERGIKTAVERLNGGGLEYGISLV
jgi:CO/xanthine dehydrogenase FAD-binding subunit